MIRGLPKVTHTDPSTQTKKEFTSDQDVRWCPGCADYSILAAMQKVAPTLGVPRENFVFVSGIGCAARFPYYMDTYGIHSIHGRAPAVATGLKLARPELMVWVITGDGDGLSIGGNHLIHAIRRNVGLKILLFNNRIYGLTKGQYSPTSELGLKTKSTPFGSIDYPLDPAAIVMGAGATFVARAIATDMQGLTKVLERAAKHEGTAFVEILQNCPIFNDGTWDAVTEAGGKDEAQLRLEHGKPLVFGKGGTKSIALDNHGRPTIVEAGDPRALVHDEGSDTLGYALSRLGPPDFPTPLGVLHAESLAPYERLVEEQLERARPAKAPSLQAVLDSGETWTVD